MAIDTPHEIPYWIDGLFSNTNQIGRIQSFKKRFGDPWPYLVHLRLGAGHEPKPSTRDTIWINIDWKCSWDFGPEVITLERNIVGLSGIPTESVDYVEADEVFEHIHPDRVKDVLYEINRVLKLGCNVRIVVPDFNAVIDEYNTNMRGKLHEVRQFNAFKAVTYQLLNPLPPESESQYGPGTWHQSLWTEELGRINLESEGFELTDQWSKDWHLYLIGKKTYRL